MLFRSHFLLEHGADPGLAEEQPLLLTAARCCGPEVVALFAGQAAILSPKQKERAFQEVHWGKRPETMDDISANVYTVPDCDLVIRPSGEQRLSNFLLWQAAYSEFWYSDVLWPDFTEQDLAEALHAYENRNRRFGGR